ncbi:MAG: mercury methylation ferredoxin HgcB [Planctomycetota bacterium]
MSSLRYLADVVTLELDIEKCTGCGLCETVCPHGVFAVEGGKAKIVDRDACMECGACARNCPAEALSVRAGVGCATAVIYRAIGRRSSECACGEEDDSCCKREK